MQPENRLMWHFMKSVAKTAHDDESANMMMQLTAVLMVMDALQENDKVLTTPWLSESLKMKLTNLGTLLLKLKNRGLIDRNRVLNRNGKGHAYALRVKETPELMALRAEIDALRIKPASTSH